MKNATKKWLIVAGGLAACAALVFIIAGQFESMTDISLMRRDERLILRIPYSL